MTNAQPEANGVTPPIPPIIGKIGYVAAPLGLLLTWILLDSTTYVPGDSGRPIPGSVHHLPIFLPILVVLATIWISSPRLRDTIARKRYAQIEWWEPSSEDPQILMQPGVVDPSGLVIQRMVPGKRRRFRRRQDPPVADGLLLITSHVHRAVLFEAYALDEYGRVLDKTAMSRDSRYFQTLNVVGYCPPDSRPVSAVKLGRSLAINRRFGSFAAWHTEELERQRQENLKLASVLASARSRKGERIELLSPAYADAKDLAVGTVIRLGDEFAIITFNKVIERKHNTDWLVLKLADERGGHLPPQEVVVERVVRAAVIRNMEPMETRGAKKINPEGSFQRWGYGNWLGRL